MQDHARADAEDYARDGVGEEAEGCLEGGEGLDVLEAAGEVVVSG